MGIESDQVVYEYLSRVGDVAQQRQLSSAARMRLVAELRDEIDRRRSKAVVDSPAAVRRIISRIGTPTDVVKAAEGTSEKDGPGIPETPPTAVPVQREDDGAPGTAGEGRPKGVRRRVVPRPRPAEPARPTPAEVPSPPHRAGTDELGDSAGQPDWWRVDSSPFGPGDDVPGFVGGVEIPELLRAPATKEEPEPAAEEEAEPEETEEAAAPRRRLLRLPSRRWSNPLLLLAAASLVAGAVLGNWFALILGWLIAYASRRLTPAESKWAVIVIPGLALTGGVLWLWGRASGRWGTEITEGQTNAAIAETWPWAVRAAAISSALFLIWRSQRNR